MEYAVVDIETTGGNLKFHKIVEIAIVVMNEEGILESFCSLINPEQPIHPHVTMIHGITDEMVRDAPKFYEIAKKIFMMTENRIFVAHSVHFDYGFIKNAFQDLGGTFHRKKICTVRLARAIFPGLKSYSLGNICNQLGIRIQNRHRALGDAEATAHLLKYCIDADKNQSFIKKFLNARSRETTLPPHLPASVIEKLPHKLGIYFMHDKKGNVLYVGKANSIKDRIIQHFTGASQAKTRQVFFESIYDITYQIHGHELLALLAENEMIKNYYPRFNRANKRFELNAGIYIFEDQAGYLRATIGKAGKNDHPIAVYKTESEAFSVLLKWSMQHRLCLILNGLLPNKKSSCQYAENPEENCLFCTEKSTAKAYNILFEKAIPYLQSDRNFVVKTTGREPNEEGIVIVEKGKFIGFGYIDKCAAISSFDNLKDYIQTCYDTQDSQHIIYSFLKNAQLVCEYPVRLYQVN